MRSEERFSYLACLIIFIVSILTFLASFPDSIRVGPHTIWQWTPDFTATFTEGGTYTIRSEEHFEILGENNQVLRPEFHEAKIGEENGKYILADVQLVGVFKTDTDVEIYSLENMQITVKETAAKNVNNFIVLFVVGTLIWILLICVAYIVEMTT